MNGSEIARTGEAAVAHVSRRRLVTTLAGILLIILAAGCSSSVSSSSSGSSSTSGNSSSEQELYVAMLRKDRLSLDRGVLSYTQIGNLKTGAVMSFEVVVTDAGRGAQLVQLTRFDGMDVYQGDVPTGGIVGVQVVACENLTCSSESGLRQPVLSKGQQAEWFWNITAGVPGPAMITLRADTYDQGSAQSLSEEIINVGITVAPTPSYTREQSHKKIAAAAKSVVGDIETFGALAGAVVAVGGVVGWSVMTIRKRRASEWKRRPSTYPEQSHRPGPEADQQREHADKTP